MAKQKACDLSGRYKILLRKHIELHQWLEIDTDDIIVSQQDLSKLPYVEDAWKLEFSDLSVGEVKKVKKTKPEKEVEDEPL